MHKGVASEVASSKVAKSRVSTSEVLILQNVEGLHSSEVIAPLERHVLKASKGPTDLDVGLKLNFG